MQNFSVYSELLESVLFEQTAKHQQTLTEPLIKTVIDNTDRS